MQVVGVARQVRILPSRISHKRLGVVLRQENRADSSGLGGRWTGWRDAEPLAGLYRKGEVGGVEFR